jgi:hypothetical protein
MKGLLLGLSLAAGLAGGCATPPPEKRVDIVLQNRTGRALTIRSRTGFLGKNLRLGPGQTWRGWALRDFVAGDIRIEIAEEDEPTARETAP